MHPARVLAGTLSETTRLALLNRGIVFSYVAVFDKWMFSLDGLPEVPSPLKEGMEWRAVRREDIPLMLSRTKISRKEYVSPFSFYSFTTYLGT